MFAAPCRARKDRASSSGGDGPPSSSTGTKVRRLERSARLRARRPVSSNDRHVFEHEGPSARTISTTGRTEGPSARKKARQVERKARRRGRRHDRSNERPISAEEGTTGRTKGTSARKKARGVERKAHQRGRRHDRSNERHVGAEEGMTVERKARQRGRRHDGSNRRHIDRKGARHAVEASRMSMNCGTAVCTLSVVRLWALSWAALLLAPRRGAPRAPAAAGDAPAVAPPLSG